MFLSPWIACIMPTAGNMSRLVIISGDGNYEPLVTELVHLGQHVIVWADPSSFSPWLMDAADEHLELGPQQYHTWSVDALRQKSERPDTIQSSCYDVAGESIGSGHCDKGDYRVFRDPHNQVIVCFDKFDGGPPLKVIHRDIGRIELFFKVWHGVKVSLSS
jgi:hypothetical protein